MDRGMEIRKSYYCCCSEKKARPGDLSRTTVVGGRGHWGGLFLDLRSLTGAGPWAGGYGDAGQHHPGAGSPGILGDGEIYRHRVS